jgi:hypothetical protein
MNSKNLSTPPIWRDGIPGHKPDAGTEIGTIVLNLSDAEQAELLECEKTIHEGLTTFVEVGFALARIRDSKLYRAKFKTFDAYCSARWDMSARRALQLRDAAEVTAELKLKQFAVLPANESQARPLTELPREQWGPAWEEIVGTAPAGRVTASHVTAVVQTRVGPKSESTGVHDLSTREERIRKRAEEVRVKLVELRDAIGFADGVVAATAVGMIFSIDELEDHLQRKERMLANRKPVEVARV